MPGRHVDGNHFEDFRLGQTIRHGTPRTLTDGDASVYIALTGSRSAAASADTVARGIGLARRPIEDLLVFNMAFGKTVPDVSLNAVANLGYAECRFLKPVYAGTTISCRSEVIGLRETSGGRAGIVYVRSTCVDEADVPVLEWVRWVLVSKRDVGRAAPAPCVPELRASLDAVDLVAHARFDDEAACERWCEATGSHRLWDDYAIGERIDHPSGMTIEEADHMTAARLYQNNARPHFDAKRMADDGGRRLAYGGHVVSICHALAHDGLENVIGVVAINGGSHVSPVHGGDTLYASTHVIDRSETPGRDDVGFLRLRLIGTKDRPPSAEDASREDVVLLLDYTVLLPRRRSATDVGHRKERHEQDAA